MAESYDGREKVRQVLVNGATIQLDLITIMSSKFYTSMLIQKIGEKEQKLQNDKYDEAVDVSQSIDQGHLAGGKDFKSSGRSDDIKSPEARYLPRSLDQSRSHGVLNKPFDEALEFSQSESDDSVDTKQSDTKDKSGPTKVSLNNESKLSVSTSSQQKPGGAVPLRSESIKQLHVEKLVSLLIR